MSSPPLKDWEEVNPMLARKCMRGTHMPGGVTFTTWGSAGV
ncbi:MAG: hypothetical protein QXU35_04220 [Zestosphaera sp.]